MSRKAPLAVPESDARLEHVRCRVCGADRPLSAFRVFKEGAPPLLMDFCESCERQESTLTLYRRFNAYATPDIVQAVFAAERTPAGRRTPAQARLLVERQAQVEPETREQAVAQELARREMARRRLLFFTTSMMPSYKPGWVHQDVARRLERFVKQAEAGLSPRLIIAQPPRIGKSQLASDMFPSWVIGHHPEWGIIGSSHSQALPVEFSRNIRDRMLDPEYQGIFPNARLRPDAKGVEAWKTTAGGGYIAAGVGTGINGRGMHIGILDDAIKDAEEANSELIRDSTYAWYRSVFRTRLAPGGGILIIATRWHFDDVTGRELALDQALEKAGVPPEERENWELVSYPAIAENDEYLMLDGTIAQGVYEEETGDVLRLLRRKGEALHPERWPLQEMLKLRNGMATSLWNALYQQSPVPEDGDFFVKQDLRYRQLHPEYRRGARRFLCVDYAISAKKRRDFTVAVVFALDANDDLYVLEVRRGRWGTKDIVKNICELVDTHDPEIYAGEQGQIHAAVWPIINDALEKNRKYLSVDESLVPIQDKETRARPLQGRVQRHKLFFSYDGAQRPEELDIVEREMLQFPSGVHDDCVDALAWGARLAMNLSLPTQGYKPPRRKSWQDTLTASGAAADSYMAA